MLNTDRQILGFCDTNCYIIHRDGDNRAIVVDPADYPSLINGRLDSLGLSLSGVLVTHGHFDHTGALEDLCRSKKIPVYINKLDEELPRSGNSALASRFNQKFVPYTGEFITFTGGEMFDLAGMSFKTVHTPGHTPGSSCYDFGEMIMTGDTIFSDGYGRTDFPGGSRHDMHESLKKLIPLVRGRLICPGHGEPVIYHH